MDFEKAWTKALKTTEIVRHRIKGLGTMQDTNVPYVLLSESTINVGDTVVRTGQVVIKKPSLFVPPNNPQFNGFEFDEKDVFNENSFVNFLIVRGVSVPSLNYDNKISSLNVYEDKLSKAIAHYQKKLQCQENVNTGLIVGSEEHWQFSLLIFICSQIIKNSDVDIRTLLEQYKKKKD